MAVERNRRARVLDLSRPAGIEVEIEVAEAAEVLMSLCALGDRDDHDTFDLGPDWLRERLEEVPPDLLEAVDELKLGSMKVAAHLLGLVFETPQPRTFPAFLDRLQATDPVEVKLHVFGFYGNSFSHLAGPDVIERAARGDSDARETFLQSLAEFSDKHEAYRNLLELGAKVVKAKLLELLPRWYEHVFAPHEQEWRQAAERDAESKRALARKRSPEQLVDLATRGFQYTPGPDIRTICFFPSWWMRPWVILWEHRSAKIFCYPIAPPPEEAEEGSPAELARIYKALGDEKRLRLLKRLSEGPLTLGDAATELGLAKSTAHHHLAILRHAGFVTIREEDEKVYNLRLRDDLPEAGELLASYLGASRSSSTNP
jgi:DNA-binding transcriptional ArsR family regulator